MNFAKKRITIAAKVGILLFATLVLSTAYSTPRPARGDAFNNFPAAHSDFLGTASYEAIFDDANGTSDPPPPGPMPIVVGPNVRVNAPQVPFPGGLLGRAETTIAVGEDGNGLVAGWNDANGFLQAPFMVPPGLPGTPGLSGFATSTDGGVTWADGGHPMTFPATTSFFSGDVVTRGDPWLAVSDNNGADTFLYANLAVFKQLDSSNHIVNAGVSVHRGNFSGSSFSWNDGHLLPAPNAPFDLYDKEALAARNSIIIVSVTNFIGISTPGTNATLCQFAGGFGQIEVWRSTDGGNTYQGPAIAQPDQTNTSADPNCGTGILNQGSDPVVGNGRNVFVAWTHGPTFVNGSIVSPVSEQIMGASSGNFGAAFSSPVVLRTIVPGRQNPPVGFNRARYNDFPRVAVDRATGRIYVAFQDASVAGNAGIGGSGTVCLPASGNPSPGPPCPAGQRRVMLGGGADTDIYLTFSDDNGATWSTPTLITPTGGDGKIQFWPVVTVGPQGEVNVVYYESQEIQLNPSPTVIECSVGIGGGLTRRSIRSSIVDTFISRSTDHGATFQTPVKLSSASSNWCRGTVNIRPNFGDYIGATTVGPLTYAVWADDRNTIMIGGVPRNVVDVFYTSARTIAGDVNGDLKVNILDVAAVAYAFGTKPGDSRWNAAADMDSDGSIDIIDVALVAFFFGTSG
jgi:dockerin type I repeat protein